MTEIAAVDTETTGLNAAIHDVWEVAIISADHDPDVGVVNEQEDHWFIRPDLSRADATGLRIGRFYERTAKLEDADWTAPHIAAREIAHALDGRHMVGAVPAFDALFLERLLRANHQCPTWHYHLVDVEALAVGWLAGIKPDWLAQEPAESKRWAAAVAHPPWDSNDLSRAVGVDADKFDRHTALGDARWALGIYKQVFGG